MMRAKGERGRNPCCQNASGAGKAISALPVSPALGTATGVQGSGWREWRQAGPDGGLEGGPDSSQPSAQKWFDIITMTTAVYEHTNNRDEIDKRLACHEKYNKFLI